MSSPNTIKSIGTCLLMVIYLVAPTGALSKTATIKIATLAPEGSSWVQTLEKLNVSVHYDLGLHGVGRSLRAHFLDGDLGDAHQYGENKIGIIGG